MGFEEARGELRVLGLSGQLGPFKAQDVGLQP